jgi:hypothetical protein
MSAKLLSNLNGVLQEVIVIGSGDIAVTQPTNTSIVISGNGGETAEVDSVLTYNLDGTLSTISTVLGTKTFTYTAGKLTGITGTGVYNSKIFTYDGSKLVAIEII